MKNDLLNAKRHPDPHHLLPDNDNIVNDADADYPAELQGKFDYLPDKCEVSPIPTPKTSPL